MSEYIYRRYFAQGPFLHYIHIHQIFMLCLFHLQAMSEAAANKLESKQRHPLEIEVSLW
jgi:hypothetical protein